ncbi:hypothetical protein [Thalassotalea fusca]
MNSWLLPVKKQLSKQIQQAKLPHAILLEGSLALGAEDVMRWLTSVLLCSAVHYDANDDVMIACGQCKSCQLYGNSSHPDALNLFPENGTHGVDVIRKVSHFFEKTAQFSGAQVATVTDADKMTVAAANALLKTLEEPTNNSFIVLVTNETERLLPTIMSRLHVVPIRPTGVESLAHLGDTSLVNEYSHASHMSFLSSIETRELFEAFYRGFTSFLFNQGNRLELMKLMSDNLFDLRWSEQVIVDLMRNRGQWLNANTRFEGADIEKVILSDHTIWQINKCLLEKLWILNEQPQANRQMIFESYLIEIQALIEQNQMR